MLEQFEHNLVVFKNKATRSGQS